MSGNDLIGHAIDYFALHQAFQRTRPIHGVEAVYGERFNRRRLHHEFDAALGKARLHVFDLQAHDALDVLRRQRPKSNHVVDAVQELRPKGSPQVFLHGVLEFGHLLRKAGGIGLHHVFDQIAHRGAPVFGLLLRFTCKIADRLRANVARHDDDCVFEAHHAALAVGQTSVIEHLQQDVEHIGVSLFDLVEQNHAVRATAHSFGKLAALVVAHVSRRGADQALHAEFLHVLRHIDTHHGALGVEEVFSERLRKLGLAHARRAEEQEAADGLVGVGKPRTAAANSAGNGRNGLVLPNHALMELRFEVYELGHFPLHHLRHGNARPCAHDLGDFLIGNLLFQDGPVVLLGVYGLFRFGKLTLQLRDARIANLGGLHQVALARRLLLVDVGGIDIGLQALHAFDDVFLVAPFGFARVEPFLRRGHLLAQLF